MRQRDGRCQREILRAGMAWQLVDPKYYAHSLRGSMPHGRRSGDVTPGEHREPPERVLWYQDTSARESGELVLHTSAGAVTWFQLTYARWPNGHEQVAEWRSGGELQLGEVPSERSHDGEGRKHAASALVRRYADPPLPVLRELTEYFQKESGVLAKQHREEIESVLRSAIQQAENVVP
jgi:hypothetical protein